MGDGWRLDFSKTHFDTFSPPDFYVKVSLLSQCVVCTMNWHGSDVNFAVSDLFTI